MDSVLRFLRGFGQFWYDFVVGDDVKIAVGAASVLVLGGVLTAAGVVGALVPIGLALLVGAAFVVAVLLDVRGSGRS